MSLARQCSIAPPENCAQLSVVRRRASKNAAEGSAERTGAVISNLEGGRRHRRPLTYTSQRFHHAGLLAPLGDGHTRLATEAARKRAPAHRRPRRPSVDVVFAGRLPQEGLAKTPERRRRRHRNVKRTRRRRTEFVENKLHDPSIRAARVVLERERDGPKDERAQQLRHLKHATGRRQLRTGIRLDVERAEGDSAATNNLMFDAARDPYGLMGRRGPCAVPRDYANNPCRSVEELRAAVRVTHARMSGRVLVRHSRYGARKVLIVDGAGASRHLARTR